MNTELHKLDDCWKKSTKDIETFDDDGNPITLKDMPIYIHKTEGIEAVCLEDLNSKLKSQK